MSILLVAPYSDLINQAEAALADREHNVRIVFGDLQDGLSVARREIEQGNVSVVISRGGTAKLLHSVLSVPVFEIGVSGYDLLRVIYPHIDKGRRLAVVGFENVVSGSRSVAEILGADLGYYLVEDRETIRTTLDLARSHGAEMIIGDTVSVNTAREMGLEAELVRSGPEAIQTAVDDASVFVAHMRDEQTRYRRLNMIMDHTDHAVICLSPDDRVELVNAPAVHLLNRPKSQLIGQLFGPAIAPGELVQTVIGRSTNQLTRIDGRDYVVEVLQIKTEGIHSATLVFIQSSGRIKDLEGVLRKHLTQRGLVATHRFDTIVSGSGIMKSTREKAERFSRTDSTILLLGDTGVGKEVFAQSIHNSSDRNNGPFVAVNCAALPDSLLESELFGYVEGAFTGARKGGKPGLFEMAHTGTIFLDEVNDMSPYVQARFLRVLQEKQVMRVGDNRVYDIDVRIIAATNKNLYDETQAGRFRKDLFYRLSVLDVSIPPLRERREDIEPLFRYFIRTHAEKYGLPDFDPGPAFMDAVIRYDWPGNVRQLRNFAEKTSVLISVGSPNSPGVLVDLIRDLQGPVDSRIVDYSESIPSPASARTLKQIEADAVVACWKASGGNISETARQLDVDRSTVRKFISRPAVS